MKIFNKFIWSKKEPSNKNDIWFDGSTWKMYTEEAWQSFTLPVDAADKVAKVLENASEVYQEKLNAGYGIIIEGNTISVDDSILYDDSDVWEAIETLQQNKVEQTQLDGYVPLDRYVSTSQVLMDNISELNSTKADKTKTEQELNKKLNKTDVATINGQSLIEGGNIVIDDTEIKQQITELSEENERLKERIEEQDVFIEDLEYHKLTANSDNRYPELSVGTADNLAGVDVVDSEINFRRSGGGAITDGVARIETIKGNSVVWNQLVGNKATSSFLSVSYNGKWHFTSLAEKAANLLNLNAAITPIIGHKYLINCYDISGDYSPVIRINSSYFINNGATFYTATDATLIYLYPFGTSGTISENVSVDLYFRITDLTQMFGSGNEPTTIEEFYQRIPMGVDLNAYNEGEVIHMDVQSIESVGVNQWDEEWEPGQIDNGTGEPKPSSGHIRSKNYTPVIAGATYYCLGSFQIIYYDEKFQQVDWWSIGGYRTLTLPQNVHFVKLYKEATTYNHDISINISDTAVNGKYFPYIKRVEDLSIIRKYFPDGMKSAGSAHDAIRYNKESGKWEKVVRIAEVDMGSLYYERKQYGDIYAFEFLVSGYAGTSLTSVMSPMYTTMGGNASALQNMEMRGSNSATYKACYLRNDAYATGAELKAAMAGVILYYELAEPIVTELDEADQFKDLDYQVWNDGTEKANAEGKSAPLAADIAYGFNAIGKIKELESLVAALRAKVGI